MLKDLFLNPTILGVLGTVVGMGLTYVIDNHYNKPKVKEIVYAVAEAVEEISPEGTLVDSFLDTFIKVFEKEVGRKPSAGELKTAVDWKDKVIKLECEKVF